MSMSVKHIGADGREAVMPVTSVRFTPAMSSSDGQNAPPTLWLKHGEADEQPLTGGRAFVMNDTGATVARYDLDTQPRSGAELYREHRRPIDRR